MLKVLRSWVDRFLSDEEAVLLAALLVTFFVIILSMGKILAPLLTGIVLAYVMQGIIKYLKRRQIPDVLAVAVTFVLFLGGFIGLLFFVIPRVWRQLQGLFRELPALVSQTQITLDDLTQKYPGLISESQFTAWVDMLNAEVGVFGQWVVSVSISQLPLVATILVYMILVPILVFFILKDQEKLLIWIQSLLPNNRPLISGIAGELNIQMSNYIRGKVVEIIIVGSVTYGLFVFYGLNYSALLAFLVGLSVIVPYLGITVVSLPVVIIGYLQFGWTDGFFYLMFWYGLLQALDGFVLVPLVFSEAVNLHPIAIITAVLVFGSWWGLWGVFFAIPLATLVKVIMTSWPQVLHGPEKLTE